MANIDLSLMKVIDIADPVEARSKVGKTNAVSVSPTTIGLSLLAYKNMELSDRHRYCEIQKIVYPWNGKDSVCVMMHFTAEKGRYSWWVSNAKQYKAFVSSKTCVRRFFGNVEKTKRYEDVIIDPDKKILIIRICDANNG